MELKKELAKILLDHNLILYESEGEVSGSNLLHQIYEREDKKGFVEMMTEILEREQKGEKIF